MHFHGALKNQEFVTYKAVGLGLAHCRARLFHTPLGLVGLLTEIATNEGAPVSLAPCAAIEAAADAFCLDPHEVVWVSHGAANGAAPEARELGEVPAFKMLTYREGLFPRMEPLALDLAVELFGETLLEE